MLFIAVFLSSKYVRKLGIKSCLSNVSIYKLERQGKHSAYIQELYKTYFIMLVYIIGY